MFSVSKFTFPILKKICFFNFNILSDIFERDKHGSLPFPSLRSADISANV